MQEASWTLIFYTFYNKDVFSKNIGTKGVSLNSMMLSQFSLCLWSCRESLLWKISWCQGLGWGELCWRCCSDTQRLQRVLCAAAEGSPVQRLFLRALRLQRTKGCCPFLAWKLVCKITQEFSSRSGLWIIFLRSWLEDCVSFFQFCQEMVQEFSSIIPKAPQWVTLAMIRIQELIHCGVEGAFPRLFFMYPVRSRV